MSQGRRLWLGSVCLATAAWLGAPVAMAETLTPLSLDMTPTSSLASPAPASSDATHPASASRLTEQISRPLQPELPPDVAAEPPKFLFPLDDATPSRSSSPDKAQPPVAKLNNELKLLERPVDAAPAGAKTAAAAPDMSASASPTAEDIEAAVEAMVNEDVAARPIGARDWRLARIKIGLVYLGHGFAPLWTNENGFTPRAQLAIARLARAAEDGLDLGALALPSATGKGGTPAERAQADVMLSAAIVAYAVQASGGRIEPTSISPEITARPEVADPFKALTLVAAAADPGAALEDFNPRQKGYRELRDKLAELRAENAPVAKAIPQGPMLKVGMSDPRVPLIRARFGLDDLADGEISNALVYDAQVAAVVANFQRARGLPASGLLTASTVRALSGEAHSGQEAAVLANMEMWRWEPRDMGEERVEVNVPDFTLKVMQGDEIIHQARVIVGKPDTQTAIFSNHIKYILVNPAWNVPISIIKKEMLPKLVNDPDYLTRAGFEVTRKGDTITVRQPPGERNALGHILFMFPNEHSIYLHDTPSRGLFASQRRAFSHGCVRVDEPMRLGELLMGGPEKGWTQTRLHALVGNTEHTIFLPHPLAIHIEYFTAFVDDDGALQMREDIYGHARKVEAALGLEGKG
jgi:murein L,D-transpeptidase YcbB/YkuD